MRLTRLRLRNWRGVDDCEVRFAPAGISVVEGPNEAGKSSLVEALDLLFDELDSTRKREVLAVKPVHRDEGSEVEADVETGAYAFTYAKRFHKRASTTLTVRAPRPESHSGREAHERARAILEETVDVALWKALRVAQGTSLVQADLGEQRWLSAALDRAAGGGSAGGERDEALFDAIRAERDRWWTAAGGHRKEIEVAGARVHDLGAESKRLQGEVDRMEADVERAAALDRDGRRLDDEIVTLAQRAKDHDDRRRALEALRRETERLGHALAAADASLAGAQADFDRRGEVVKQSDEAGHAADEAARVVEIEAPGIESARAADEAAELEHAAAVAAATIAEHERDLAERDRERLRDVLDLEQLGERLGRIEGAERAGAAAGRVVASNRCDDECLATVRGAHEKLLAARVRLEAASPVIRMTALGACTPRVDGAEVPLASGATHESIVSGTTRIEVPGLAIEVSSGAGTSKPRDEFDKRRLALDEACAAAGVADLDAAVAAHGALADARRALGERDRIVKESLRDLSRELLERKVAELRERLAAPASRPARARPAPATFDEAQEAAQQAKDAAAIAILARDDARRRRDECKGRHDDLRGRIREHEVTLRLLREGAAAARRRLDDARAVIGDDALAAALAAARGARMRAVEASQTAAAALVAAEPELVERLAGAAQAALDLARTDRQSKREESLSLRAALEARGDEGLSARLGAVASDLEIARLDFERTEAQADAAKLLFDTFAAERDAERLRYVAPFREKVEALGRMVFGPTLQVEIGDDLRILRRTLDGRTVDYESLSGGAKEQLGVVGRLACALLAAGEGGVPVILDDAFGFSDPDRLDRMGVLLESAGRTCQVILLTCDPGRARRVPGATVIPLR